MQSPFGGLHANVCHPLLESFATMKAVPVAARAVVMKVPEAREACGETGDRAESEEDDE